MSGFNLGGAVNGAANWCSEAPIIRAVVCNPVFTALLITALVVVVAMGLYHYPIKKAGAKRGIRALLYVFLLVTAVAFVHHYAVMRLARDTASRRGIRDVFSGIQQSLASGYGTTPVLPALGGAWAASGADDEPDRGYAAPAPAPPAARALPPPGARPDNVALGGGVVIADVVLPASCAGQ